MRNFLDHIVVHRGGALLILLLAACLEVFGDSSFQTALYRSSGISRTLAFLCGAASLAAIPTVAVHSRFTRHRDGGVRPERGSVRIEPLE